MEQLNTMQRLLTAQSCAICTNRNNRGEGTINMINPISKEDKDFLAGKKNYEMLGRIAVAIKGKDEKELKAIKSEVNGLRGIKTFTLDEAKELGAQCANGAKVNGKDIISALSSGREISKAFRSAAGLSKSENESAE